MSDLMDGINEAFESATEEGVGEEQSVVSEDAEDQAQEASHEEAEEQPESEVVEDEPVEGGDGEASFDWLEKLDEVPTSALPPRVAKLRADRDRMASEIGEMRKRLAELEAAREGRQEPQQSPEPSDPMPDYPTENDDFQTVVQKMDAISEWRARQVLREQDSQYQEKFQTIEEREKQAQLARQQEFMVHQASRIENHPEFDDNVGSMMQALVGENPGWQQALGSPQGWDQLFNYAKYLADKNSKVQQVTTKKATARQRAVPRVTNQPKNTAADVEIPEDPGDIGNRVGAIFDHFAGS